MIKRIIAITLTLMFVFVPSVFAAQRRDFVVGDSYKLDFSTATVTNGAVSSGELTLNDGGSASFELTMPFYSDYLVVKSASANKNIDIDVNGVVQNVTLSEEGKTKCEFITPIRADEIDFKITSHGNVVISEVTFSEIAEIRSRVPQTVETTDFEEATDTAFIVREGSPVVKSNTAIRYLDYNNVSVVPVYVGGSLFIPADALAQGLGCYFEEDQSRDFAVMRKKTTEIVYLNGSFTFTKDGTSKSFSMATTNINGKTYYPVRTVAELFEYYVIYKEGFVICDYRTKAKALANEYFDKLVKEFAEYMPNGTMGKTFYVAQSANASDSNDGTIDRPFKTIAKASETVRAGDTVIIRGGEYSELLKPTKDGTATNPITYKAYPGEDVLLTAADRVSDFADFKDGIVVAAIPWDLGLGRNQVFYNDKNLVEGRYPNAEIGEDGLMDFFTGLRLDPLWPTHGDLKGDLKQNDLIKSGTLLQEEDGTWDGAVYVCQRGSAWTLCSAIVDKHTKGQLKLKDMSSKWWFDSKEKYPDYGYLTCHVATIDQPGEWTMKNGMLYMMPPEGETADTLSVLVKRRQLVIDLNDRSYVHVEGIRTFGGGARMNNAKMCVINNCNMNYISHYTYFNDNRNLFIDDGNIYNENGAPLRGEVGVYMGGSDNAFINSRINFSAGTGVFLVGSYCYIANNYMNDLCYGGTSCGGIHFDTEAFKTPTTKRGGHTVVYNTVTRVARNAVSLNRVEENPWIAVGFLPCEIAYNDISDSSICTLDTGMMYLWGSNMADGARYTNVHNNYVYSTATKSPAILGAIYWDNWMMGSNTYDNLIWATMDGQFNNDVYEQHTGFATSYSTVDAWNNINLGIRKNAKDDLTLSDFRSLKPFKVGSTLNKNDYDLSYKYYAEGDDGIYYAKDAEFSDGVVVENNKAKMTSEDQWIKFTDVDFYGDSYLNVVYTGDYYKPYDKIKVAIGDTPEEPIVSLNLTLNAESKDLDDLNTVGGSLLPYTLFELQGKKNVWIKPVSVGNSGIYSIYLSSKNTDTTEFNYDYKRIVAGTYSMCQKGVIENELPPTAQMRPAVEPDYPILTSTWKGGWTCYPKVNVSEPCTKFNIALGTSENWLGNKISIRIGSYDGEVLATVDNVANGWTFTEVSADLNRRLDPGVYDLYLTFDGEDNGCSDIQWFGLN